MNHKFKILENVFITLGDKKYYRIQATKNFADVKVGDLGGYISKDVDLSTVDNSRVLNNSRVFNTNYNSFNSIIYW